MRTKFWSKNLKRKDHLEDSGMDGTVILKQTSIKSCEDMIGLIWLRIGISGRFFLTL